MKPIESFKYEDVTVNLYPDYDDPLDMDFESEEDRANYARRFETGDLASLVVEVTVKDKTGLLEGRDVLGGVHVGERKDVIDAIKDYGMIENAKSELDANIKTVLKEHWTGIL